jgi:hypothetical protein
MHFLTFHPSPPSATLLRPAGRPPEAVFYPLGHPTPYTYGYYILYTEHVLEFTFMNGVMGVSGSFPWTPIRFVMSRLTLQKFRKSCRPTKRPPPSRIDGKSRSPGHRRQRLAAWGIQGGRRRPQAARFTGLMEHGYKIHSHFKESQDTLATRQPWPQDNPGHKTSLATRHPWPQDIPGHKTSLATRHPWPQDIPGHKTSLATRRS